MQAQVQEQYDDARMIDDIRFSPQRAHVVKCGWVWVWRLPMMRCLCFRLVDGAEGAVIRDYETARARHDNKTNTQHVVISGSSKVWVHGLLFTSDTREKHATTPFCPTTMAEEAKSADIANDAALAELMKRTTVSAFPFTGKVVEIDSKSSVLDGFKAMVSGLSAPGVSLECVQVSVVVLW